MSGVYERNRNISTFDFFNTARAIKLAVNKLMMNERYVPKRYRFTNAVQIIDMARSIVYNVNRSDQFYPNSSFNVLQRRKYLTLAIADCEQICQELQDMIDMGLGVKDQLKSNEDGTPNKIEELIDLIEMEIGFLKGTRKGVKLIGKQSVEDKIRDAKEELNRLMDLQRIEEDEKDKDAGEQNPPEKELADLARTMLDELGGSWAYHLSEFNETGTDIDGGATMRSYEEIQSMKSRLAERIDHLESEIAGDL